MAATLQLRIRYLWLGLVSLCVFSHLALSPVASAQSIWPTPCSSASRKFTGHSRVNDRWQTNRRVASHYAPGTLVFDGFGVPRAEVLLDELAFGYEEMKPHTRVGFVHANEQRVIDEFVFQAKHDYLITDFRLDQDIFPQTLVEPIAYFPVLIEPLVPAYHLTGPALAVDVTSEHCGPLRLTRFIVAAIYNLNITNWRDPRILALQTPEVAAALPNEAIRIVVQASPNEDLHHTKATLQQWGGAELAEQGGWIYGAAFMTVNGTDTIVKDTIGWSTEYLAQPNIVSVPGERNIVQGIAVTPYSFALAEFSLVISEGFTQYASLDSVDGQQLDAVHSLSNAVTPSSVLSPTQIYDELRNGTTPGVWPLGVPIFVMMRISNFSRFLSCSERRELWLFWRWLLTNQDARERTAIEGFLPLNDDALSVLLDYISSIHCVENGTERSAFLVELAAPQHQGNGFKAILGFNVSFLIVTVALVAGYVYSIKDKLSVPMINLMIYFAALLSGSVLNYVAVIYFYEVPSTSEVCQNRVWMACLGFTMLLSALFSRGYQIFAVHQLEQSEVALLRGMSHNVIQVTINAAAVAVQLVLLIVWTRVDPFHPVKTEIDDLNLTFTWVCSSEHTWVWWGLEIGFALCLEGFGLLVVYRTWNLRRTVKESKWVSIAIYNFLVILTLLVALFGAMTVNDDTVLIVGGVAITCLSFITMSSLFVPRLLRLRSLAEKDTESDDASDKRGSQFSNLSTGGGGSAVMTTRRIPGSTRSSEDNGSRFLPSMPSTRNSTPKTVSPSNAATEAAPSAVPLEAVPSQPQSIIMIEPNSPSTSASTLRDETTVYREQV